MGNLNTNGDGGEGAQVPDIERAINWSDADGDMPDDLKAIPIEHIRAYVGEKTARVAAETESQTRQRLAEEAAAARGAEKTRSEVEAEITWAEDLDKRRNSADAATREAATREFTNSETRYTEALARKHMLRQQLNTGKVLADHYTPQFEALKAAGRGALVEQLPELSKQHGGVLAGAYEFGKTEGDAAGYARGLEEGRREGRVAENANGAQALGDRGAGNGKADLTGIDRTKPGAGAEIARRALASNARSR